MIFYFLIIVFILILFVKMKYRFYISEPVFHIYDIHLWLWKKGIIDTKLPKINTFTNIKDIETIETENVNQILIKKICEFIRIYDLTIYLPKNDILESFGDKSYISIFNKINFKLDNSCNNIAIKEILGIVTSKPVNIKIYDKMFMANYIDKLCIHHNYLKKGLKSQILQTHYYNISHLNKKINVSLMKKEYDSKIIPICRYTRSIFKIKNNRTKHKLLSKYSFICINEKNFYLLVHFFNENKQNYNCWVSLSFKQQIELVKKGELIMYAVVESNGIHSVYIFRKPNSLVNKELSIDCISTITINRDSYEYKSGFFISIEKCVSLFSNVYLVLEEIGDSISLHNSLINEKNMLKEEFDTMFYLYNYSSYSIPSDKCFILV